jgi:Glycoside hydrolase family 5 C-terminal domain/Cellulase (glycosyl hydrolase family 5)
MGVLPLIIDGDRLRDPHGREVTFRGINIDAGAKNPRHPDQPSHVPQDFFDGDNVSFVDRPFTEEEAHEHFGQLKRWGYNALRYIFTWEALEHGGPGIYDEEFIAHTVKILRIAKDYGFYVFMDPHQDVWSRFTGGSGAPMWTLYACGLNPETFHTTQAAVVQNTWDNPAEFPKMMWPTNYTRLATETTFTLFYAGRDFAPNAIIDGKNIQDYLTDHFINACVHLARRIHEAGDLEEDCVIGWESMNEPHRGLLGWEDLEAIPESLKMRKGTMPTPWQSILSGSGRAVEVDTWDFGSFGPYKSGRQLVDPEGVSAWLPESYDDSKYGWKRDPGWQLGECLWAQNGVWSSKEDQLLKKDYFSYIPKSGTRLDYEKFTNTYFMEHYRRYRDAIRAVHKNCIIILQSAVLEIPPRIIGTPDDEQRIIFASHYYDGLTLLTKHWNKWYNFDIFGFMRGKYSSPMFAVKVGETAIRNSFREQLEGIQLEGKQYTGIHPVLFTEIGIPYDMDNHYAYKTGDYSSQVAALDANHFALEGSGANGYTLWTYVASNNHRWGDNWNGEDLSIFSVDDSVPTSSQSVLPSASVSSLSVDKTSSSPIVDKSNLQKHLKTPQISNQRQGVGQGDTNQGMRAAEAFLRPSPISTVGNVVKYGFDLRNCTFTFSLTTHVKSTQDLPTLIFLPEYHFPADKVSIEVTSGTWIIEVQDVNGEGMQMMKWFHDEGEQSLNIKGVRRKLGIPNGDIEEEEVGYFETMRRLATNCSVM